MESQLMSQWEALINEASTELYTLTNIQVELSRALRDFDEVRDGLVSLIQSFNAAKGRQSEGKILSDEELIDASETINQLEQKMTSIQNLITRLEVMQSSQHSFEERGDYFDDRIQQILHSQEVKAYGLMMDLQNRINQIQELGKRHYQIVLNFKEDLTNLYEIINTNCFNR